MKDSELMQPWLPRVTEKKWLIIVMPVQFHQKCAKYAGKNYHPELKFKEFLPKASFGFQVLSLPESVCPCVCVCVNPKVIHTMTHYPLKLESPKFDSQ